jgi:hypothetical protein
VYSRESFDVPRIVEMMTAHELARGRRYTGLVNDFAGYSELSGLVHNGRAVLVARAARPAGRLTSGGAALSAETQSWTFYRAVFPVAERSAP